MSEWWVVKPKHGPALYFDHDENKAGGVQSAASREETPIIVAREALGLGLLRSRTNLHSLASRPENLIDTGKRARGRRVYMQGFAK